MNQRIFDKGLEHQGLHTIKHHLELPFKPFTLGEVHQLTGADIRNVDTWANLLGLRQGLGVHGLDYSQTFAIFVGQKYLLEGAPPERATAVVLMLGGTPIETIEVSIASGRSFPVPNSLSKDEIPGKGMFVPCPNNTMAIRLHLGALLAEFRANIKRVFPNG